MSECQRGLSNLVDSKNYDLIFTANHKRLKFWDIFVVVVVVVVKVSSLTERQRDRERERERH